jgi:hypothetical protein
MTPLRTGIAIWRVALTEADYIHRITSEISGSAVVAHISGLYSRWLIRRRGTIRYNFYFEALHPHCSNLVCIL